ncbi:MAG: ABC transporter permease subunit, partial [Thermomicrobiales bacterium]
MTGRTLADDAVAGSPSQRWPVWEALIRAGQRFSLRNYTLLLVLGVIWIAFQFLTENIFLTPRNLGLLALQSSIVSLAAISAVMLIVARNFDLSVGSAVAMVGTVLAILTVRMHVHPLLGCLLALAAGLAMGAWQGMWVTRLGVSSFIVTLAGLLYFRGFSMILADGATIAPLPPSFTEFATGYVSPAAAMALIVLAAAVFLAFRWIESRRSQRLGLVAEAFPVFLRAAIPAGIVAVVAVWLASFQGIPNLVLVVAVFATAAHFVMSRTRYGARLYAIGGNPEAARLAG